MTQAELAEKVSKSRSAITNTLRLLDLPDEIQDLLSGDRLTAGHARAILSLSEEDRRMRLAERIMAEGLSVREAEALARLYQAGQVERAPRPVSPKSFKVVARKLRRLLGTNVRVRLTAKKGKIEIDFQGEEELERIFRALTEGETTEAGEQA
jgi:ParB family chromosome partitioning protein